MLSRFGMQAMLPNLIVQHPWLVESKVDALRTAIAALDAAFGRFWRKQSAFPKFKNKRGRRSVTTTHVSRGQICFSRRVGVIPFSEHRPLPVGGRKRLTISHAPSGRYFASVLVETEEKPPELASVSGVIGIDEGLRHFVTLSTGRKIGHGKHYRANLCRLKREQRRLARKVKGSKRRECQRVKIARLHEKISNSRLYEIHLVSTNLVRKAVSESQAIAFQKSAISNQMRNRHLALAIADAGWGELRRQLAYKCARAGVPLVEIDQWQPTSYPCHRCGVKAQGKTLSNRVWICAGCGARIDRDVNAARMIAGLAREELRRREAPHRGVEDDAVRSPCEASSCASSAIRVGALK